MRELVRVVRMVMMLARRTGLGMTAAAASGGGGGGGELRFDASESFADVGQECHHSLKLFARDDGRDTATATAVTDRWRVRHGCACRCRRS